MVRQIADIKLYSIKELHSALGVNIRTLRYWFHSGRLKGVKIGGEWHISEGNLSRFLNAEEGGEIKKARKTRRLRSLKKTKKERSEIV